MGVLWFLWLNSFVRFYTRYKAPLRRKDRFTWVWVAVALAAAVGFWRSKTTRVGDAVLRQRPATAQTNPTPISQLKAVSPPVNATTALTHRQPAGLLRASVEISPGPTAGNPFARPVQNAFEAQLGMARMGISPGSLDGAPGPRTRWALVAFQQRENLPVTGTLDASTVNRLMLTEPAFTNYVVSADDLARLRPLGRTWLEKSQQDRLDYETVLEMVAEKAQSHPRLIQQLNPSVDWTHVVAGTSLVLPFVERPAVREKAALARIHLAERTLQVFGESDNLLGHFPCSIAAFAEKRPVGELHVATVASNPNYTFDPDNFPESAEARQLNRKLILPPGPNNPVGAVWVGLDRPGYGIHGTPRPEQVGRAESHGCFRLANWNAEYFSQLVWVGMPVFVEP